VPRLRIPTRRRALLVIGGSALLTLIGLRLPVAEHRITRPATQLDRFAPVWQFREVHSLRVPAPPARTYQAIQRVRADEIFLFRALTWIRRGGRAGPSILNAGNHEALLDVATGSGFLRLADSAPHELVIGTVVLAPDRAAAAEPTALPAGVTVRLCPGDAELSRGGAWARRLPGYDRNPGLCQQPCGPAPFAAYWRVIYPGSALIGACGCAPSTAAPCCPASPSAI
jgi:hypothetical protein